MTVSTPTLYSFRRCPYAMRARLALYASGANVELREIILRDKPEHMLEISPKGTVPVLQLADGKIIDESFEIMIYALGRQDPDEWLGIEEETTNFLIKRNDNEFKYALDRYKYPDRYPDEDDPNFKDNMFEQGVEILKDLNTRIEKNGALVSNYNTLTDYAIFPFIRQFRNVDQERFAALGLDALSGWLNAHLESDLFQNIMEKHKPWKPEDTPLTFGTNAQAYDPA